MTDAIRSVASEPSAVLPPHAEKSTSPDNLAEEIINRLTFRIGKDATVATPHDWLTAAILVVRDRAVTRWMESTRDTYER
ncbi:MAG: hypothetical protein AAFR40_15875, partial [Pseudomonadota bacterium]